MKKLLFSIALTLCIGSGFLFAQTSQAVNEVQSLIKGGLKKNSESIKIASEGLSDAEKMYLYQENKKENTVPLLLNIFLGYGIGSYVQKDIVGGVIGTSLDVGGLILFTTGAFLLYDGIFEASVSAYASSRYGGNTEDDSVSKIRGGIVCVGIGSAVWLGSRIFQIVRPFSFSKDFNRTLSNSLGVAYISANFAPIITEDGNIKVALATTIKF